ncbi:MAG TPA: DUF692 domain-containing protein [Polyangiaceae bacterium]
MRAARLGAPDLGVGIGLRVPHYRAILEDRPPVDFFEIISENFMVPGGKPRYHLDRVLESYPVVQHGVSLGIGGPAPPDRAYLTELKALVRRTGAAWVSDHFCWCGTSGAHLHDLLPLPYTREAVTLVSERARMVQDFLEVRFALENTSSYLTYTSSTMPEWEFVAEIVERADIGLLFDVNNVYVSAYNHGFDPYEFVERVPADRVVQIHVAGHTHRGTHIVDTHLGPVAGGVWDLYRAAIARTGPVSTLVEWDEEIPALAVVLAEAETARRHRNEAAALGAAASPARTAHGTPDARTKAGQIDEATTATAWMQGGPRENSGRTTARRRA